MAEQWADYLISKVRYNADDTHIVKVLSHVDNGDTVEAGVEMTRPTVVLRLEAGSSFMTVTTDSEGKFHKGARVQTTSIDGVAYIKTVADTTKQDNLGSLPRF